MSVVLPGSIDPSNTGWYWRVVFESACKATRAPPSYFKAAQMVIEDDSRAAWADTYGHATSVHSMHKRSNNYLPIQAMQKRLKIASRNFVNLIG